jgi:hypothetical protein
VPSPGGRRGRSRTYGTGNPDVRGGGKNCSEGIDVTLPTLASPALPRMTLAPRCDSERVFKTNRAKRSTLRVRKEVRETKV